jgi:hypothetical protein
MWFYCYHVDGASFPAVCGYLARNPSRSSSARLSFLFCLGSRAFVRCPGNGFRHGVPNGCWLSGRHNAPTYFYLKETQEHPLVCRPHFVHQYGEFNKNSRPMLPVLLVCIVSVLYAWPSGVHARIFLSVTTMYFHFVNITLLIADLLQPFLTRSWLWSSWRTVISLVRPRRSIAIDDRCAKNDPWKKWVLDRSLVSYLRKNRSQLWMCDSIKIFVLTNYLRNVFS